MGKKVKVYNRNKFDVGIKLINPNREQNIKGGSFTIIEDDDIYYLNTISSLFRRGMLVVEDEEVNINLGFADIRPVTRTDAEIEAILRGNFLKMKSELLAITENFMKHAIFKVASTIADELSGSKIKFISEFCGKKIIID